MPGLVGWILTSIFGTNTAISETSSMPDLQLSSQPQNITSHEPVANCTAWCLVQGCEQLASFVTQLHCDLETNLSIAVSRPTPNPLCHQAVHYEAVITCFTWLLMSIDTVLSGQTFLCKLALRTPRVWSGTLGLCACVGLFCSNDASWYGWWTVTSV